MKYVFKFVVTFFVLFVVCRPGCVCAKTYFGDDFSILNPEHWDISLNLGSTEYTDDGLLLSSNLMSFPFIVNKPSQKIIPDSGDFNLKIRFRYPKIASMGNGIGVGYLQDNGDTLIEFGIWQDETAGLYYQTNNISLQGMCSDLNSFKDGVGRVNTSLLNLDVNDWHIYELERIGDTMNFYVDRNVFPSPLYSVGGFNCLGKDVFFGNNRMGGSITWTSLEIDSINVTVTDPDLSNKKVIILPGLGASWNARGLLGSNDTDLVWEIPFFVKHYENLKDAFVGNNFVEGQNLFIWPYDWRQPVSEIVQDLDGFVGTVTDDDDEIVLIGHSLGGLTARLWYQQNNTDPRIDKIISLGSPHYGAVDAYEAWNGGEVSRSGLQSIVYNLLILLNKRRSESVPDVIHRIAPVVQDLQPTLDFAYEDNELVSFEDLTDFNSYLAYKNIVDVDSLSALNTFFGSGFNTKEFLTLGQRSFFDKRLGLWPDGRVIGTTYSLNGDGTVLSASARMGNKYMEFTGDHGSLPDIYINKIMELLELSGDDLSMVDYGDIDSKLIFYIASPAHLEVMCGNNDYASDSLGFVVIDKSTDTSVCSVDVVADDEGGDYKLVVGDSQNSWWSKFDGRVTSGQIDRYWFDDNALLINNGDIFSVFRKYCVNLLNDYSGDSYLNSCLLACDNKDANLLIDSVFAFRDKYRNFDISFDMLDKLIPLINVDIVDKNEAEYVLRNGSDMFDLVESVAELKLEKGIQTDDFGVEGFGLAGKIFETTDKEFEQDNYDDVKVRFELARKILRQVW